MCRTGGRRCKGSHASNRATQKTRKQRSRAKQALRKAKASGNADAIRKATERLDAANAAHQAAKEKAMHHNESADQHGDVTNIVHGENHGYQADVINGGLTFDASTGRFTIGNDRGDSGDVTASHGVHINNFTQSAGRVGSQNDVNHDNVTFTVGSARSDSAYAQDRARYQEERARYRQQRAQYRASRAANAGASQPPNGSNVHTGAHASETSGTGPVHIADDNGNTVMQAGVVHGGIWVNGKRVG